MKKKKVNRSCEHGFNKGKYCLTYAMSWNGCLVDEENINLDFSKVFDSVSHNMLISKLRKCRLNECTVQWIKKQLNGRSQRVVFSHRVSSWRPVTPGVSHGSVLPAVDGILDF